MFPTGELHIRRVQQTDASKSYRCQTVSVFSTASLCACFNLLALVQLASALYVSHLLKMYPSFLSFANCTNHIATQIDWRVIVKFNRRSSFCYGYVSCTLCSSLVFLKKIREKREPLKSHLRHTNVTDQLLSLANIICVHCTTESFSSLPPRITDSKPTITVMEGEKTELACAAQGHPIPAYSWSRKVSGSSEFESIKSNHRLIQLDGTLIIRQALPSDAGRYKCTVNNTAGTEAIESELILTCKP